MGGSASKGARQLPKSIPTTTRSAPEWAKTSVPSDPPPPPSRPTARPSIPPSSQPNSTYRDSTSDLNHGRLERGSGISSDEPAGRPIGRSTTHFSGEKDDVVRRDALDPHFAANLSRLGPVQINEAGTFIPTQSSAQKTLTARRQNLEASSSDIPPPGHLNAQLLSQLLDDLKSVKTKEQVDRLYDRFGMSEEQMRVLRRWVNSPSVGSVDTVNVDGDEVTEMKAVWLEKQV